MTTDHESYDWRDDYTYEDEPPQLDEVRYPAWMETDPETGEVSE